MDAATLSEVMGRSLSLDRYAAYVESFNQALIQAQCTTVRRVAMFCAQTGTESGGLRWLTELASGAEYQGRADLGNQPAGFGVRYKGRGIIQCTGAYNYQAFSKWAHAQGLVDSPTYFFDRPETVAELPWAFISASWYWVAARKNLNAQADAGDVRAATRSVNGGLNGLADRQKRYDACLKLGAAILPTPIEESTVALSQNGWIANDRNQVRKQRVPGTELDLTVRWDAAGQVLLEVASAVDRLVEDIDNGRGALDDWGYAERPVRGGSDLSNHASGTAIDLNAPKHPLGTEPTANFTPAQIATIHRILAVCDGVVRWGGDYVGRKDPMHFEINDGQDIHDCERALAAMRAFNSAPEEDDMTPQESARLARVEHALEILVQQVCGEKATIENPFPGEAGGGGWMCSDGKRRTLVDIGRRVLEKFSA